MKAIFSALNEVCRKEPFREKILIMPSFQVGRELLQAFALAGHNSINLSASTAFAEAEKIAGPVLASSGLRRAEAGQMMSILENILAKLRKNGRIDYFASIKPESALGPMIYTSLQELRVAGVASADLSADSFVDPVKANAIVAILECYEHHMCEQKLYDAGDVWRIAMQQENSQALLILPPFVELTAREKDFVTKRAGENFVLLAVPTEKSIPAEYDFFRAIGAANEIAEVFRRIVALRMPIDTVQLVHANSEEHVREIFLRAIAMDVPVTFAEGIPVVWNKAGRCLLHLLDWISADFDARILVNMLYDGEAKFSQECFSAARQQRKNIRKILRETPIGRGRNRYQFAEDWLQREFDAVFATVPIAAENPYIEVSKLAAAVGRVYARWGVFTDASEIEAQKKISEFLSDAALWADYRLDFSACLDRLREGVTRLRFLSEGSKAGHLYVQSYTTAGWTRREQLFFVGMNSDMIPGAGLQDPVLLDDERQKISRLLEPQGNRSTKKRIQFEQVLAGLTGKLGFSWKSGDVVSDRDFHPSPVVLTALRMARGNEKLAYDELEKIAGRAYSCQPNSSVLLDETDWWLDRLLKNQASGELLELVRGQFAGIDAGLAAKQARRSEELSVYTGLVNGRPEEMDPRQSGQVMSASRIETLAKCPFKYYLQYVLDVKPPQDFVYDPASWLTVLERGKLLHSIFERYMKEWSAAGQSPLHSENIAWMERIAAEEIEKFEQQVAPSSLLLRELEIREILQVCRNFLQLPCNNNVVVQLHCEVALASEAAGPLVFPLDQEQSIRLQGSIDRIDEVEPGKYQIWDYKTGGDKDYETCNYFKQGKHIQPALYAAAWEEKNRIADNSCEVTQCGYAFPGSKARREQVVWQANRKAELKSLLKHLFDLVATGVFIPTPDKNCYYCDYCNICSIDDKDRKEQMHLKDAQKIAEAQQKNPANAERLAPWKDVQLYG